MINELNIKYFLCLAETLNFTEVGKQMYISQQAVSKHIAGLEEDLGVQLLIRSRNRVELTENGLKYYNFFRSVLDGYRALRAEIEQNQVCRVRSIRIGYQNWIDFGPAPGMAMAELRSNFPDLFLLGERHEPNKLLDLLYKGDLDIILIHKRFIPKLEGVHKLALITTPMQVVVSRHNRLCEKGNDYRVFRTEPMLIDSLEGESAASTTMRAHKECRRYGFDPREIVLVPNRDSIYTAAELDQGIFFGSSMTQITNSSTLVRYDTDVMETLYCVWKDQEEGRYLEKYAKQLQKEYQTLEKHYMEYRDWGPER